MRYRLKPWHELCEIDELAQSTKVSLTQFELSRFQDLKLKFFVFHLQEVEEVLYHHQSYHGEANQILFHCKFRRKIKRTQAFCRYAILKV
jgi:hypothetical protein